MRFDILVKKDDKFLNLNKLKIKRKSRSETHKLYGSIELFKDLTEDINIRIEFYEKQGDEYRKTPYHIKGSACQFIATDDLFYPSLSVAGGLPKNVR